MKKVTSFGEECPYNWEVGDEPPLKNFRGLHPLKVLGWGASPLHPFSQFTPTPTPSGPPLTVNHLKKISHSISSFGTQIIFRIYYNLTYIIRTLGDILQNAFLSLFRILLYWLKYTSSILARPPSPMHHFCYFLNIEVWTSPLTIIDRIYFEDI